MVSSDRTVLVLTLARLTWVKTLSCSMNGNSSTRQLAVVVPDFWPIGNLLKVLWWLCRARPICLRLFWHCMRAAASRTFCTAGSNRPIRTAMMAITTSNSISVKAVRLDRVALIASTSSWNRMGQRPIGIEQNTLGDRLRIQLQNVGPFGRVVDHFHRYVRRLDREVGFVDERLGRFPAVGEQRPFRGGGRVIDLVVVRDHQNLPPAE